MSDPYVGKLTYFRVYSGQIKAGDRVLNTTNGKTERIGRILQMHANHREERDEIGAGEIAAAVGLKSHDDGRHARRRHGADRARVDDVPRSGHLGRDRAEDEGRPGQARRRACSASPRRTRRSASRPTRRPGRRSSPGWASCTSRSSSTACMREFTVDANVGRPQVAYRETIGEPGREDPGQVRPPDRRLGPVRRRRHQPRCRRSRATGYEFVDKIVGGQDPEGVHPGGRRGHPGGDGARASLAGYPVVDVKVELVDGSYHDVDSSERAFKIAGSMAFKEAHEAREAEAARADDGRRGRHARGLPRRRDG